MLWNRRLRLMILAIGAMLGPSSCRQDMHDQARVKAYSEDPLTPGASSARLPPAGAVPLTTPGSDEAAPVLTMAILERGRERYTIFCEPCHGVAGRGDGPVLRRGFFPMAPDLQAERLRQAALSQLYAVVRDGQGGMPSYAAQVPPQDRWAVVAYVRALQLSQHPEGAHGSE